MKLGLDPSTNLYWMQDLGGYRVYRVKKVLVQRQTPYQKVEILELEEWGKTLFLDGDIQSAELDEFIYHELLVHPAMLAHGHPRRVLICGTGEGRTVEEVLRYPTVEKIVAVDIDREVVELCQAYLGRTGLDDPRVELRYEDVARYLEDYQGEPFDVAIVDVTDDVFGPAGSVHRREFYQILDKALACPGAVAVQGTSAFSGVRSAGFTRLYRILKDVFHPIYPYSEYVPSFDDLWGFFVCLKGLPDLGPRADRPQALRYYDDITCRRVFNLARPLRQELGL